MKNQSDFEERYLKAKERVTKIKGFYTHLSVYIIVNTVLLVLIYVGYGNKTDFWTIKSFYTPLGWGIGLLVHALVVFGPGALFVKRWEEKKLDQFIKEDQQGNNQWE